MGKVLQFFTMAERAEQLKQSNFYAKANAINKQIEEASQPSTTSTPKPFTPEELAELERLSQEEPT